MTLSKKSSASRWKACRRLSSKSGNNSEFGTLPLRLRRCSHCPAKLLTKADERLSASIRRDLRREHVGVLQTSVARGAHQRLVGQAAPEEEREPRRQLGVGDAIRRAGGNRRRLGFRTEHERRTGKNATKAELNAVLERAAAFGLRVVVHQIVELGDGQRTTVGLRRQRRKNSSRAGVFSRRV